jgi:hypothetical protein
VACKPIEAFWLMIVNPTMSASALISCRMAMLSAIVPEGSSKVYEFRESWPCRLRRDGTMVLGGTGVNPIVAVIVFEEVSRMSLDELMEYPLLLMQVLAGKVELELTQVKPAYIMQVLEQPSPLTVLPSSH